jgi:ABC-2 type transport system permease protein
MLAVLSLGYQLSVALQSQLAASQASMIATFLPSFLLSGFIYPIDQMPWVIQVITHILPARYFMAIMRSVFLKGTPLALLWEQLLALSIFAAVFIMAATRSFKKRLR